MIPLGELSGAARLGLPGLLLLTWADVGFFFPQAPAYATTPVGPGEGWHELWRPARTGLGGFTQPLHLRPARRCTTAQPFSTPQQLQPTGRQQEVPFAARWIHTSTAAAGEVVVPAMGDSITEGSVAAVLKQPGAQAAVQAKPTTCTICWGWSPCLGANKAGSSGTAAAHLCSPTACLNRLWLLSLQETWCMKMMSLHRSRQTRSRLT